MCTTCISFFIFPLQRLKYFPILSSVLGIFFSNRKILSTVFCTMKSLNSFAVWPWSLVFSICLVTNSFSAVLNIIRTMVWLSSWASLSFTPLWLGCPLVLFEESTTELGAWWWSVTSTVWDNITEWFTLNVWIGTPEGKEIMAGTGWFAGSWLVSSTEWDKSKGRPSRGSIIIFNIVTRRWGESAGWIMDVSCCMGRVCRDAASLGSRLRRVDCFDTEWAVAGALPLFGFRSL